MVIVSIRSRNTIVTSNFKAQLRIFGSQLVHFPSQFYIFCAVAGCLLYKRRRYNEHQIQTLASRKSYVGDFSEANETVFGAETKRPGICANHRPLCCLNELIGSYDVDRTASQPLYRTSGWRYIH